MTSVTSTCASGQAAGWLGRRRQTHWIGEGPALKGGARDARGQRGQCAAVGPCCPRAGSRPGSAGSRRDPAGRADRPVSLHPPAGGQCARRWSCRRRSRAGCGLGLQARPGRGVRRVRRSVLPQLPVPPPRPRCLRPSDNPAARHRSIHNRIQAPVPVLPIIPPIAIHRPHPSGPRRQQHRRAPAVSRRAEWPELRWQKTDPPGKLR